MPLEQFLQQNNSLADNPRLSVVTVSDDGVPSFTVSSLEGVTYPPDDNGWSGIGRIGLWGTLQQHPNPQKVIDIGTGPGTALLLAAQDSRVSSLIGCDIASSILEVAAFNFQQAGLIGKKTISLYNAYAEELPALLTDEEVPADVIYFCLPQVPSPDSRELTVREVGDYYNPDRYHDYEEWGLGLVFSALQASKELLSPNGQVVAVLGGRTPYDVKVKMITDAGFQGEVIERCFVQQDPATSLGAFKGKEGVLLYEKDPSGQIAPEPLPITEAIIRQQEAGSEPANIWHTVEAWRITPLNLET